MGTKYGLGRSLEFPRDLSRIFPLEIFQKVKIDRVGFQGFTQLFII